MQRMIKKNLKMGLPMLAAAAASAWIGLPAAHANFVVGLGDTAGNFITGAASTATINGVLYNDYIVQVMNDGNNGSGTDFLGGDWTIDTLPQPANFASTTGALYIDLTDTVKPGDGFADANVLGTNLTANSSQAQFGNALGGTFLGVPDGTYAETNVGAEQGKVVAINSQTNTQNTDPNTGNPTGLTGNQATFQHTAAVAAGRGTTGAAAIPIDSQFTAHTIQSLEVAVTLTSTATGTGGLDASFSAAFANVVIPAGTGFKISGTLESDTAFPNQNFTFQVGGPVQTSNASHVGLTTAGSPANTITGGPVNLVGTTGHYVEQDIALTSAAKGSIVVNGFSKTPTNDTELYALDVLVGGVQATSAQLTTIINELTADGLASGETISTTSPSPAFNGKTFAGSTYDLFFTFVNPAADPAFNYDFSNSGAGSVTIPEIGVVPEPTGVGVLALGAVGLMARRRRLSQANA